MDVIVSRVCTVTVTNNASSWNRDLTYKRGAAMGGEFKKKGVNMLLGPVVGPAGRVVTGGRNWEGISVDPYLSGALVYETVAGIQDSGVITSTKVRTYFFQKPKEENEITKQMQHFIANEQETNRNPSGNVSAVSSNIDDKTMHELYLW
jgi:beta-glucosidase